MADTKNFYQTNAESFYTDTIGVDLSPIYERFEKYLAPKAKIIDAGAGSGRDTLYFKSKGHEVYAFDSCQELCELAKIKSNLVIHCHDFLDVPAELRTDAIWACASLLHLKKEQLEQVFSRYFSILSPNGVFYASFKYGAFSGERNGRFFTDLNEESLQGLLKNAHFEIKELWKTADARPGRENEAWLNVILKKKNENKDSKEDQHCMTFSKVLRSLPLKKIHVSDEYQKYDLKEFTAPSKEDFLIKINDYLEYSAANNHTLVFRGEAYIVEKLNTLIEDKLNYLFLVGAKAKSAFNETLDHFQPIEKDKEKLINDTHALMEKCKDTLDSKKRRHYFIQGEFPSLKDIDSFSFKDINRIRMLLLAFLHNKGEDNFSFKETSTFISTTSSLRTAYNFATDYNFKLNKGKSPQGIIYVYSLPLKQESHPYIPASTLQKELKNKFNVSWFNDDHNEYIVSGCLYPHKLLGILIITNYEFQSFILNPWASISLNITTKRTEFTVDQENKNFLNACAEMGYTTNYFFCNDFNSPTNLKRINKIQTEKLQTLSKF